MNRSDSSHDAGIKLLQSDMAELEAEIVEKREAAKRHAFWAFVGVTPAALIPLWGLALTGFEYIGAVFVLVVGLEAWRALKLHNAASELEAQLDGLRAKASPLARRGRPAIGGMCE